MKIEQFVMAYGVEQDRIRAVLPDGFTSLRPVLRINAEIRDDDTAYLEFNTPVEGFGKKGWLNICCAEDIGFIKSDDKVIFDTDFLEISFRGVGAEGGCPAEKDNDGCFFINNGIAFRPVEKITVNKEFCDCSFRWKYSDNCAHGVSRGKTIPAFNTEIIKTYEKLPFSPENAAEIPCIQVLGAYKVIFNR